METIKTNNVIAIVPRPKPPTKQKVIATLLSDVLEQSDELDAVFVLCIHSDGTPRFTHNFANMDSLTWLLATAQCQL